MKVNLKFKILINGLFPVKGLKIDEFTRKTGIYDFEMMNKDKEKDEDFVFYLNGAMTKCAYSVDGDENIYYEYFENAEYIGFDIVGGEAKEVIANQVKMFAEQKMNWLEKRLRLTTNLPIGLPGCRVDVFDQQGSFIVKIAVFMARQTGLKQWHYDEQMKQQIGERLRISIEEAGWLEIENKNRRFKRATSFYNDSFYVADNGVRFTLLVTALEALFNLDKEDIQVTISNYTSKLLMIDENNDADFKKKIKLIYDKRSKYIHGNNNVRIKPKDEIELRELVRKVLLLYWMVSMVHEISRPREMMKFLDDSNIEVDWLVKQFYRMLNNADNLPRANNQG